MEAEQTPQAPVAATEFGTPSVHVLRVPEQPAPAGHDIGRPPRHGTDRRLGEIRAAALSYMTTKPEGEILARMWLYLASCGPSEAIAMVDEILRHRSQTAARMAGCGTPAASDPARPAP